MCSFLVATVVLLVLLASPPNLVEAGFLGVIAGYGLCQTACNVAWVACCSAAGVVAGAGTGGLGVPAAVIACNGLQGVCMGSCALSFLVAPTP